MKRMTEIVCLQASVIIKQGFLWQAQLSMSSVRIAYLAWN